ncbi:uncharacterized protein H6S33_011044 [Morchella sextelata]|uniref:uncharacterized protein n=1 Tax=Morchella sextelata TaxID=1174677 RepID=UPI001D043A47|nr:uncharacterized protein H6S33_011044 [Morchella sextelata]KAH0611779.1 hypothetical protein H6S33_011044 [Morchella sextelata]
MCYFTPTEWGCGHLTYSKVPCRHVQAFKEKGKSCPYNTTLGTLRRNRSCGDAKICVQARIDTLNGEDYIRARVRAMQQDSQETLVPSTTANDEAK